MCLNSSWARGAVAPGELISIFGSNFGPAGLRTSAAQNSSIPMVLGNTRAFFDGRAGAITAATANQINVFVPYEVTAPVVNMVVDVDGVPSGALRVPVSNSALGLSSAVGSGTGQGAVLNQDGSYNSRANPARRGTVISVFGTGEGAIAPPLPDGALVISSPLSTPVVSPIGVTIAGQKADVLYAGSAPSLPAGVFQLNVRIPLGATPGDAPISASAGSSVAPGQVTVAI